MDNDFSQVFETIINTYGIEILKDDALFLALFLDMAPRLNTEKKIIKRIKDEGMLVRFFKIATAEESAQQSMILSLDDELREQLGFPDKWSSSVISAFCDACSITMPEIQTQKRKESGAEHTQNANPTWEGSDRTVKSSNIFPRHSEKKKHGILPVIIVITVIAAGILVAALAGNGDKNKTDNAEETDYYTEETKPANEPSDEPIDELAGINVEQEVTRIREIYNDIMSSISNGDYSQKVVSYGSKTAIAYFDGDELRCVMTDPDENDFMQWFYYENEALVFSYIEKGSRSERLYFSDNRLIRRRHCDDKNNPDDGRNDDLTYDEEYMRYENSTYLEAQRWLKICSDKAPNASNKVVADVIASSQLNEPEYGINHYPHAVLENKDDTAWIEGVEGNGIGESITLQLNSNYTISGFKIKAGYFKSNDLYNKNSRPKKLLVTYSDMYGGGEIEVTLKDTKKVQTVTFDTPVEAYDITLIIESVYPGNKYEDTAITYIELF